MWRDPKWYKLYRCIRPWFKFNNDLFKVHCVRFCCLLYYHGLLRGLFYASTPLCAFSFKQHFNFQPYHDSEIKIVGNAEHFTMMPERNALKYIVRSNLQNHKKLFCFHLLFQYLSMCVARYIPYDAYITMTILYFYQQGHRPTYYRIHHHVQKKNLIIYCMRTFLSQMVT